VERIDASGRPEVWISRVASAELLAQAKELERGMNTHGEQILEHMPLFGLPFAVKDNIDVAGMQTSAACPEFAYVAHDSAHVVQRLQAAGAILIGKTNLDQFATGLVGTRSPYGAVRNAVDPAYVSGGSSSGSAVAVALGLVSFALGTDTAGSGRVPAGFNGIVGLKPTRGLLSMRGVVPACRTLDCISILAGSVPDAWQILRAAAGFDAQDPYSRHVPMHGLKRHGYRIAIPDTLEFFGDRMMEQAFAEALEQIRLLPDTHVRAIPYACFAEAARLLYQGPWVAERRAAIGAMFDENPEAIDPTVYRIVAQADRFSAADAFRHGYRMAELKREAEQLMAGIDFLVVPTAPAFPTLAEVAAEPLVRNSELGYYTNFVNLFDMAALSIPTTPREDGLPAGVTLIGPAGSDHCLADAGEAIRWRFEPYDLQHLRSGSSALIARDPVPFDEPVVQLAVVGAHLEGQPLNWQLLERGARRIAVTHTSAHYRLYALAGTVPPKPGLARVRDGEEGMAVAIEVWELPQRSFGGFVAEIPAPLGIGSVQLSDGSWVKGFICEPWALSGAQDITSFGGWCAYLASRKK
jgi:allophanate hydrolase